MNEAVRKNFCPNCEDQRQFLRQTRREEYNVRGEAIEIDVAVLVCRTCEETVVDRQVLEDPIELAFVQYRERKGLLTPGQIKDCRTRYSLSQKAFATLLGMSEATINRYEQGVLQDEAHDNMLRACESAAFVRDLLSRRGHLLTDRQRHGVELAITREPEDGSEIWAVLSRIDWTAIGRSGRVDQFSGFRPFSYERYAAAFIWFCRRRRRVFGTEINKMLFYADFLAYKTYGRSLTGSAYAKLPYGPVPDGFRGLEEWLEHDGLFAAREVEFPNGTSGIEYRPGPNADAHSFAFDTEEERVLEFVVEEIGKRGSRWISERSHRERAWQETEDNQRISYHMACDLSLTMPDEAD